MCFPFSKELANYQFKQKMSFGLEFPNLFSVGVTLKNLTRLNLDEGPTIVKYVMYVTNSPGFWVSVLLLLDFLFLYKTLSNTND